MTSSAIQTVDSKLGIQSRARRRLMGVELITKEAVAQDAKILDMGCGLGEAVDHLRKLGYDAYGFDLDITYKNINPDEHPVLNKLLNNGYVAMTSLENYRIPFDDNSFDVVISDDVFEHVQDYPATLRELYRVMKPAGRSLHVFPSRYRLIEAHSFVPLASIIRWRWWLYVWAALGIRNPNQKRKRLSAREVVEWNLRSLKHNTNYLSKKEITAHVLSVFDNCQYRELDLLRLSRLGRYHGMIKHIPMIGAMISRFRSRALYFVK